MGKDVIKPMIEPRLVLLAGVCFIALVTLSFGAFFTYTVNDQPISGYLYSFAVALFLGGYFSLTAIVLNSRENRKRRAAARGDATKARLIAQSSFVGYELPIVIEMRWKTGNVIPRIFVAIGGVIFFLLIGLFIGSLTGYQGSIFMFAGAVGVLAAFLFAFNRYSQRLIIDEQGIEMRYRWTRQRIPWGEVRQLWMEYPQFDNAADALYPTSGAGYEVASAKSRIAISVVAKGRTDFDIPDHATYYERVAMALAAIMQHAGVALWGRLPPGKRQQ